MSKISGGLLIHKPIDLTSSDVVTQLKWAMINSGYAEKGFRIGHGGTLDPFATGVLVVLFGEATKLADTYLHSVKGYEGIIQLGISTTTGDHTGEQKEALPIPLLLENDWQGLANTFVDTPYFQTPPMYSAKKKNGKALHELARAGIEIERDPILKKIDQFTIKKESDQTLYFQVQCESGTYVRVLAEDLALKTGTVAHLKTLIRTHSSDASLSACEPLEKILTLLKEKTPLTDVSNFRRLNQLGSHIPSLEISEEEETKLRHGIRATADQVAHHIQKKHPYAKYVVARNQGQLVALFEHTKEASTFRLQRIFNPENNGK